MKEKLDSIKDHVLNAIEQREPLKIVGGDSSKSFLGRATAREHLVGDVSAYSGVISYEPTELYITARAGTTLSEINHTLTEHGQMLAFDPPQM